MLVPGQIPGPQIIDPGATLTTPNCLGLLLLISQILGANAEEALAPHPSPLAWKIPRTEGPGRLQSMGSLRVGHD